MKNYLLLALAAVALCFTACKKDNPEPTPVAVTGISLDKTMVALEIDESATVQAVITPSNATNKAVEWSVADTAVATVSNGVVTGVAVGETTLTATTADGGHTATIPVKVVTEKVPVTGISFAGFLSGGNPTLKEGSFDYAFVMFTPENATNKNLTFTCDKPELVSIQEDASYLDDGFMAYTITAIKAGEVEFTAVSEDGGFTLTKTMTILPIVKVTSITIGAQATKIGIGEVTYLNANLQPEHPDEDGIEWSSSNPGIATVEDSSVKHGAKVTGVAAGKATITATAKDGSVVKGSIEIEVVTIPTSITFDGKTDQEIYTWWGKEVDLKAKVTPEGVSLKHLTWQWIDPNASSNPDGLKYNVTDDKATLTYTWPSQTSKPRGVDVRAFYADALSWRCLSCQSDVWLYEDGLEAEVDDARHIEDDSARSHLSVLESVVESARHILVAKACHVVNHAAASALGVASVSLSTLECELSWLEHPHIALCHCASSVHLVYTPVVDIH